MDFAYDPAVERLREALLDFMDQHVYPAERTYHEQAASAENRWDTPPVIDELKARARERGRGTCFSPTPSTVPG